MSGRAWVMLAASAVLTTIGLTTGITIYYLGAALLAALLLVSFVSVISVLFTTRASIRSPKHLAQRGDDAVFQLSVFHAGLIPVGMLRLDVTSPDDAIGAGSIQPPVRPLKRINCRITLHCAHRGVYEVGISSVTVSDIFCFFTMSRRIRHSAVKLIVPPCTPDSEPLTLQPGDNGPQGKVRITEDRSSPAGIRDWQEGDSLKNIHWKISARRRLLTVRTFEESAKPDILYLMDCAPVNAMQSHVRTLEDVMCETCLGSIVAQLREGSTVRLPLHVSPPTELAAQTLAEVPRFTDTLTYLKFNGAYSLKQIVSLEMRRLQRTGAVVLITTRLDAELADLMLRMNKMGVQVRLYLISETMHNEYKELCVKLGTLGIKTFMVDPWKKAAVTASTHATL